MQGLCLFDRLRDNNLRSYLSSLVGLIFGIFMSIHLVFFFLFLFDDWNHDLFVFLPLRSLLVDDRRLHRSLKFKLTILRPGHERFCRLLFVGGYLRGLGVRNTGPANNLFGLPEFQLLFLLVFRVTRFGRQSLL